MKSKMAINRIFINILVSYFVVLLVPLTFIGIINNIAGNSIRSNIIETNQTLLAQSMKAIEDKFNNMRRVMMNFSRQRNLLDYVMTDTVDISYIAKSMDLKDQISYIESTNDIIDKIYIYSNHNMNFFSESGLADLSQFCESYYRTNNINIYNLPSLLSDSHMGRFLPLNGITQAASSKDPVIRTDHMVTKDEITFIQTLPVALSKQYDGAVVVLLNASSITQMLNYGGLLDGGSVAILDENGNKLVEIIGTKDASSDKVYSISYDNQLKGSYQGNDVIISKVISPTTKWIYMTSVPGKSVLATLNQVGRIVSGLVAAMLLIGVILVIYLARYNALPFTKISQIMYGLFEDGASRSKKDQYGTFVDAISRLVASNRELHNTLREQTDLLASSFLNRLISGSFDNNDDIFSYLSRLNLSFDGSGYMIVHIRFFSRLTQGVQIISEFTEAYSAVENMASGLLLGRVFLHKQDIANIIIIVNPYYDSKTDGERHTLVSDNMSILFNQLLTNLNVVFHMAVGGYYTNIKDVSLSAKEAQRALSAYDLDKDQSVLVWYDDRQNKDSRQHPYSLVFEQHLLNQIAIGNSAKVKELLEQFYTNNIVKRKLSYKTLDMIKHELVSTLVRSIQERGINNVGNQIINSISFDDPIDVFFSNITSVAVGLCCLNTENTGVDDSAPLGDLIIAYIREHMEEPDLGYIHVCEHFNISRYHLNKYLQEKTEIGFTGFLENLRMETAVRLLEESELSIHEISSKTGYTNDKTFRRAFKRCFGYSPSDRRFREKAAQGVEQA